MHYGTYGAGNEQALPPIRSDRPSGAGGRLRTRDREPQPTAKRPRVAAPTDPARLATDPARFPGDSARLASDAARLAPTAA